MQRYLTIALIFLLGTLAGYALSAQASDLPMLPASGNTRYNNLPVAELNLAHRQQRNGQFEQALLTYNSALAWQPDWVPALAERSALLARMGRDQEANRDRQLAERQNPTATAFYLAKGRNGLLPFLALYPQEWYADHYGFPEERQISVEATTPQAYFIEQYLSIMDGPDTAQAVLALQQKVDQDVLAAKRSLETLPRDYNPGVKNMLLANLAMLNHDYREAVQLYNDAQLKYGFNWPELPYNRGLGQILLHNYMNGCEDLAQSAKAGFAPAGVMYQSLCNF